MLREERCNSYVDAGHTKGNERGAVFFCQFFARGVCGSGADCPFFHLVPSAEDCAKHDKNPTTDIFGRDRFAEEKSNRGGVGSFFSMSRTLYVGYGAASEKLGTKLQEVFERVFSEWGPLEDIYIVRGKSIAFVRYVFRASAEMAKESMNNQSLQPAWWPQPAGAPTPEVLNVRWAYDDPNPVAIRRNKREREEAFADAARRAEERLAPEQREALRMQRALEDSLAEAPGSAALHYPSTDGQFGGGDARETAWDAWAQAALDAGFTPQQVKAYYEAHAREKGPGGERAAPPPPGAVAAPPSTRVVAADCFEYDADDPAYADAEAGAAQEVAPPRPRRGQRAGRAGRLRQQR